MCLLSARLPATHAECIRNAKPGRKRKTLHHRDNICHLPLGSGKEQGGKIKTTLLRISYLDQGETPNNFPCRCLERRLLADARLLSCSTSEQVFLNAIQQGRGKGKPASVFLVAEWQAAGWTHAWQMAFQRVFMNHLGCVQWLQTTLTTKPEGLLRERGGGRGRAERKPGRKDNQGVRNPTRGLFPGTGRWE